MSRETLANEIWRACDIMRRDNNCGGIMEYIDHLSWLLFLRFLDAQEDIFESEAKIAGRAYTRIIDKPYRWSSWARKDWHGDELIRFVRSDLLPYLSNLHGSPEREMVNSIFSDRNIVVCDSPYNLKDVLEIINKIDFQNSDDIHTVSFVYEDLLKKLGSENRLAGEFYTPRPIVRFMVEMIDPQIRETVYDPACGSCGFLAESYVPMKKKQQTAKDYKILQGKTFYGQEKKALPTLLGTMNMVLHGVLTPHIVRRNTLEENIRHATERFDVVLTNPPFGGTENRQIQQNFPVQSQKTELLFVQHIMKKLKTSDSVRNPRCGMVVPEGTLFRGDAFALVKKDLLEQFNLHTIVSLPPGVFLPYSDVNTSLIFFERPGPTNTIWYYELLPPPEIGKYTKGKPIQDEHFNDCRAKWKDRVISEQSWIVPVEEIVKSGYDLTAKNPNRAKDIEHRPPEELIASILEKEQQISDILREVERTLGERDT